ncbi:hypothetical protein INP77_06810 [Methylophilus sp. 13]|uniref:hypothetical protein n=1 Tax=Methylophilus sp. 13 TaxID=2781018 RepID=UPI00188FAC56|nr:hypothetical protein [Methylophilus sp. 13]MBF5039198.1 hypothetical protein [Methylophilus sp. 13]
MGLVEKISLIVLVLFGSFILWAFVQFGGSISDSIFPELFGFTLEGVFLVILFGWYQKKVSQKNLLDYKTALRTALRGQLAIFFQWSVPLTSSIEYLDALTSPAAVSQLIEEVEKAAKLPGVQPDFLKSFAERELPAIRAMLPTAAQISPNHLMHWNLIVNNLQGIVDSEKDEETFRALVNFLDFVRRFDEEEINA